jgi:ABC-type transport system involved in multi-copper enzyme maturation permease subunit
MRLSPAMKSLLWKDYRLNSLVLALGVGLWLAPYVVGSVMLMAKAPHAWRSSANWAVVFAGGGAASLGFSALTLLLLGANAIARERSDRSAEFLAYLPPSRGQVLGSMATVPLVAAGTIWASDLFVVFVLAPALGAGEELNELASVIWSLGCISTLLFGAAWLGSSLLDSPFTAVGLALGMLFLVGGLLTTYNYVLASPEAHLSSGAQAVVALVVGIACFAGGVTHYLKRSET